MDNETPTTPDWYARRHELASGQVFMTVDGLVQLDRGVEGDATKWAVLDWNTHHKCWSSEGSEVEPGDLIGEPIEDTQEAIAKALSR
jgi:hypothetical protein